LEHQENIHFHCEGVDMALGSVRFPMVGGKRRSLSPRARDPRGNRGIGNATVGSGFLHFLAESASQHYFALTRTFTVQSRARAERLLAQYRERAGSLSEAQFDLGVAQIVALADNGHARVQLGPLF
jgi:hypothetical protein